MKLINRTHTYYGPNISESTVYGGCIIATREEWRQAIDTLNRTQGWTESYYLDLYRRLLREDLQHGLKVKGATIYAIRVDATRAIAKNFGLTNYQRRNYIFRVLD